MAPTAAGPALGARHRAAASSLGAAWARDGVMSPALDWRGRWDSPEVMGKFSQEGLVKSGSAPSLAEVQAEAVHQENRRLRDEIKSMCDTIKHQSSQLSQLWAETNLMQSRHNSAMGSDSVVHSVAALSRRRLDASASSMGAQSLQRVQSTGSLAESAASGGGRAVARGGAWVEDAYGPRERALEAWANSRFDAARPSPDAASASFAGTPHVGAGGLGLTGALGRYPCESRLPLFTPVVRPAPQLRPYSSGGGGSSSSGSSTAKRSAAPAQDPITAEAAQPGQPSPPESPKDRRRSSGVVSTRRASAITTASDAMSGLAGCTVPASSSSAAPPTPASERQLGASPSAPYATPYGLGALARSLCQWQCRT